MSFSRSSREDLEWPERPRGEAECADLADLTVSLRQSTARVNKGDDVDPQRRQQPPRRDRVPRSRRTCQSIPRPRTGRTTQAPIRCDVNYSQLLKDPSQSPSLPPFKKCFRLKCRVVFVPHDFKPGSPRRVFCSMACFEAHWHERIEVIWKTSQFKHMSNARLR